MFFFCWLCNNFDVMFEKTRCVNTPYKKIREVGTIPFLSKTNVIDKSDSVMFGENAEDRKLIERIDSLSLLISKSSKFTSSFNKLGRFDSGKLKSDSSSFVVVWLSMFYFPLFDKIKKVQIFTFLNKTDSKLLFIFKAMDSKFHQTIMLKLYRLVS